MNRESLSALLDGECTGPELDRLLESLAREPALKAEWSRLCLARESLKSPTSNRADAGFAGRVMAAIETEAPRAAVIPFPSRVWRVAQPLVGYAMAASVGAVAVFGLMSPPSADEAARSPIVVVEAPIEADDPVSSYLMDHSARSRAGMGGSLGYARVAAHRAVYQRQVEPK